jgi:hypothetical protein
MKTYKDKITLIKNNRGCYILDTVKGCSMAKKRPKGCYDNCYAQNIASRYAFDFDMPVKRKFEYDSSGQLYFEGFYDTKHENEIIRQIENADMPFVRIGEMGDPSNSWEHTLNICKIISRAKKTIVIITKHLKPIHDYLFNDISKMDICINTSVSALDNFDELDWRLMFYNKLKQICKSVLRIVSCDFNKENKEGLFRAEIQDELFKNDKIIDTVFRPSSDNPLIINEIIKVEKVRFLKSEVLASIYNKNAYLGYCNTCPEMCGINL